MWTVKHLPPVTAILLWMPLWLPVLVTARDADEGPPVPDRGLPRTMPSGSFKSSFSCGDRYGYFADIDLNCEVFHVCNPSNGPHGERLVRQYSFACANHTIFDQLTLTCAFPEDSIPCKIAADFVYVNEQLGQNDAAFLTDGDIRMKQKIIEHVSRDRVTRDPSLAADGERQSAGDVPERSFIEPKARLPPAETPETISTTARPLPITDHVVTSSFLEVLPKKDVNEDEDVILPPRYHPKSKASPTTTTRRPDGKVQPRDGAENFHLHHGHGYSHDGVRGAIGGFHVDSPNSHFAFGKETERDHHAVDDGLDKEIDRLKVAFTSKFKNRGLSKADKKELKTRFTNLLDRLFDDDLEVIDDDHYHTTEGDEQALRRVQEKMKELFDLAFKDELLNMSSYSASHENSLNNAAAYGQHMAVNGVENLPSAVPIMNAVSDGDIGQQRVESSTERSLDSEEKNIGDTFVHSPRVVHLRSSGRVRSSKFKTAKYKEEPNVFLEQLPHHSRIRVPIATDDFLFNVADIPGRGHPEGRTHMSTRHEKAKSANVSSRKQGVQYNISYGNTASPDVPANVATPLQMPRTRFDTTIFKLYYPKGAYVGIPYNISYYGANHTEANYATRKTYLPMKKAVFNETITSDIENADNDQDEFQFIRRRPVQGFSELIIDPSSRGESFAKNNATKNASVPMHPPQQPASRLHTDSGFENYGEELRAPFVAQQYYHDIQSATGNHNSHSNDGNSNSTVFEATSELPLMTPKAPQVTKPPAVRRLFQKYDSYGSDSLLPQVEEAIMELQRSMLDDLPIPRDFRGVPFGTAVWRRVGDRLEMVHMLPSAGKTVVIRVARKIKS